MHRLIMFADSLQDAAAVSEQVNEVIAESISTGGSQLMLLLTIFVLAVVVGAEIISKIPPTLHTPLMSGSNAISGITLVGAILAGGSGSGTLAAVLGVSAVILATINVVGGFVVTNRMLAMFRSKK